MRRKLLSFKFIIAYCWIISTGFLLFFSVKKLPNTYIYYLEAYVLILLILIILKHGDEIFKNEEIVILKVRNSFKIKPKENDYSLKILGFILGTGFCFSLDFVVGTYSETITKYEQKKTEASEEYNRFNIIDFVRLPVNQLYHRKYSFPNRIDVSTLNPAFLDNDSTLDDKYHFLVLDKTLSTPKDDEIKKQIGKIKEDFKKNNKSNIDTSGLNIGDLAYLHALYCMRENDENPKNFSGLLYLGNELFEKDSLALDVKKRQAIFLKKLRSGHKTYYSKIINRLVENVLKIKSLGYTKKIQVTIIGDFINQDMSPNITLKRELYELYKHIDNIRVIFIPQKDLINDTEKNQISVTKALFIEVFKGSVEFEEINLSELNEVNQFYALNSKIKTETSNNEIFAYCDVKYNSSVSWDSCNVTLTHLSNPKAYLTIKSKNDALIKGKINNNLLTLGIPREINNDSFKLLFSRETINSNSNAELEIYVPDQNYDIKKRILITFLPLLPKRVSITWLIAMVLIYTSIYIYLSKYILGYAYINNSSSMLKIFIILGTLVLSGFYMYSLIEIGRLIKYVDYKYAFLYILIFAIFSLLSSTLKKFWKARLHSIFG